MSLLTIVSLLIIPRLRPTFLVFIFQLFVFKHWKCFKVKTFTKENYHLIDWHLWHIGNFVFYSQSQHIFSNSHFHGIFSTDSVVKKLNMWCIERSVWPFYHSDFFQGVQFWAADLLFQKLLKSLTLAAWQNAESFFICSRIFNKEWLDWIPDELPS